MRIQNSGVKAGFERLVWPLASLAYSLIHVRSYSASFILTFLTVKLKAEICAMALKSGVICRHRRTPEQLTRP